MRDRAIGVATVWTPRRGHERQARLQVGVGDLNQIHLNRADRAQRRQALLRIAFVYADMFGDECVQEGMSRSTQGPLLFENLTKGCFLFQDPRVHRGDQGVACDEVHLQSDDAQQKVAIDGGSLHCKRLSCHAGHPDRCFTRETGSALQSGTATSFGRAGMVVGSLPFHRANARIAILQERGTGRLSWLH